MFYLFLQILYLDSLVVDEPVATDEECPIRAAAWIGSYKMLCARTLKAMASLGSLE
jgi:hypothetical protein